MLLLFSHLHHTKARQKISAVLLLVEDMPHFESQNAA